MTFTFSCPNGASEACLDARQQKLDVWKGRSVCPVTSVLNRSQLQNKVSRLFSGGGGNRIMLLSELSLGL